MKKKLYFENNADPMKFANSINTYVNFVYDTKTGELKLVDSFRGEVVKELVLGTATVKQEEQEGGEEGGQQGGEGSGEQGGETGGDNTGDNGSGDDTGNTGDNGGEDGGVAGGDDEP